MLSKKHRIIFEGIDLSHPLAVLRESTCDKILDDVLAENAMLIRGPPFSGKTSLAMLLYERARSCGHFKHIVRFTMLCDRLAEEKLSHGGVKLSLQSLLGGDEQWLTELGPVLVIVDEIQMIYDDKPEASFFWNAVKAMQQRVSKFENVFIIMLGSYGGDRSIRGESSTPVQFANPRGLEVLRFSPEEYAQLVSSFNKLIEPEQFALNERMSQALFNLTLGIPGLTAWALQKFQAEYLESNAVSVETPTETTFMSFLLGRFIEVCESTRAISSKWTERKDAVTLVKKLLEDEDNPPPLDDLALETELVKEGIVTRPLGMLQFSAPIVRCIVTKILFNDRSYSLPPHVTPTEVRNFDSFLALCIGRMSKCAVFNNISEGIDGKVYERAFQMEFYRAAVPLVARISGICCPDAGAVFNSSGFLDFYVSRNMKWAFELTRNHSRLDEHLSRFDRSTGTYRSIPINRWAVVNFVQCEKGFPEPCSLRDGEVRVLFLKTNGKFKICRKEGAIVVCTEGYFTE